MSESELTMRQKRMINRDIPEGEPMMFCKGCGEMNDGNWEWSMEACDSCFDGWMDGFDHSAESFAADSSERCFACGCAGDGKGDNPGRNELIYCELCEDSWCDCCREPSCADKHEWYFCTRNAAESFAGEGDVEKEYRIWENKYESPDIREMMRNPSATYTLWQRFTAETGITDVNTVWRIVHNPWKWEGDLLAWANDEEIHRKNAENWGGDSDGPEDLAEVRTDLSQKRTNMSAVRTVLSVVGLFLVWDSWRWSKEERKLKGL
jgi:hypothetical protein